MARELKFIAVSEGTAEGIHWIGIDGDAESLEPSRLKQMIPELAYAVVSHDKRLQNLRSVASRTLAAGLLRDCDAVIVDGPYEVTLLLRDRSLHSELLERCTSYLPER